MQYYYEYYSPIGKIFLQSDGCCLTELKFENQKYFVSPSDSAENCPDLPLFKSVCGWLDAYFNGENPEISFDVRVQGSEFCRRVWDELMNIPYGKTDTYAGVAARLEEKYGKKTSARAVGGAVGRNPVAIIIPCHRVVGSDGGLTGYAAGMDKKRFLLSLEGVLI